MMRAHDVGKIRQRNEIAFFSRECHTFMSIQVLRLNSFIVSQFPHIMHQMFLDLPLIIFSLIPHYLLTDDIATPGSPFSKVVL